jgi:DNA replication and repair protein RecF
MRQALKQRNAALRRGNGAAARAFDTPFSEASAVVAAHRRSWALDSAAAFAETCAALGEQGQPSLTYAPDHHREEDNPGLILAALDRAFARDIRRGVTTVGPHRDDVVLSLDGKDMRTYGSAGQQRTAAIALRLLEAATLRRTRNAAPIALYDDVFAELDRNRQENLLEFIRETLTGQAIITAPRDSEVPKELLDRARWRMTGGRLER